MAISVYGNGRDGFHPKSQAGPPGNKERTLTEKVVSIIIAPSLIHPHSTFPRTKDVESLKATAAETVAQDAPKGIYPSLLSHKAQPLNVLSQNP